MTTDLNRPRTRRALLGAAVGAVGASVIGAVAAPGLALADDDGAPILVGSQFGDVRSLTSLANSTNDNAVFAASSAGGGNAIAGSSASASGVHGESSSGVGVSGFSASATAVEGDSLSGIGISATASTGIALRASASDPKGTALLTSGRIRVDGVSGVATILAGTTSVTFTPGVDLVNTSFVLLTPKANIGARALWFSTNTTANTISIHLSPSRPKRTNVAWLLIG